MSYEQAAYTDAYLKIADPVLQQFDKIVKKDKSFHAAFLTAFLFEASMMVLFFPFLVKSAFFALMIAILLITIFSYFTLRQYRHIQKMESFKALVEKSLKGFQSLAPPPKSLKDEKLSHASTCLKLADKLYKKEATLLKPPFWLPSSLISYWEKGVAFLCYNDVFLFKEILIKKAVEEHIVWVRNSPTDQDSHSSLAEAYICLAGLYFDPLKPDLFKAAELKAIEELKILQEMSPHDTWALEQLALSYHALKNREEEVKTYEKLLHLKPANKEYLFHLGRLYFSLGLNAKGLKIYENLKKLDASKSDALIAHYGLN